MTLTPGEAMTGLGYAVGAAVFLWAARRRRLATDGIGLVAAAGFVAGIVGAKLSQTVASGLPLKTMASPGGRALLGGLVFGWLGVEGAKRWLGIRRSTGDLFALALPAGEAVGRIGCHLNGCCYGVPYAGPLAIYQHGTLRVPSQLLTAAVAAALFFALLAIERKDHLREGDLFRLYLVGFGIARFGLEFVRWRESLVAGLSPMQWFCLDLVALGLFGLLRKRNHDMPQLRPGI